MFAIGADPNKQPPPNALLDKPIAIIRIDAEHAQEGVTLGVDFGKQVTDGVLTPLPFYSSR